MVALGSNLLADVETNYPTRSITIVRAGGGTWTPRRLGRLATRYATVGNASRCRAVPVGYQHGATCDQAEMFVRQAIQPFKEAGVISGCTVQVDAMPRMERIDVLITLMRKHQPAIALRYSYLYDEIGKRNKQCHGRPISSAVPATGRRTRDYIASRLLIALVPIRTRASSPMRRAAWRI